MAKLDGKKLKRVLDPALAKACAHPLRGHVWITLFERGEVSPTEIADELELEVSEVSYHFRELKRRNLIRLVRTVTRRGFDEHFYEPVGPIYHLDDEAWTKLPPGVRSTFSGEMVGQVIERLAEALEVGAFGGDDTHLSQTWLLVDEQGWGEVTQVMEKALDRLLTIREGCTERRKSSAEPGIPVVVSMAAFETPAGVARRKPGAGEAL